MKASDVLTLLEEWFPSAWAEPWDNAGLQVGSGAGTIERVLCALDPTLEVIHEASERGAGMLVTHHPLLFEPLRRVDTDEPAGQRVAEALRLGVTVVACHTNADVARPGVSDALADALGLEPEGPLEAAAEGSAGLGRVAAASTTAGEMLERCRSALGADARLLGDPQRRLSKVALCGGSGASLIPVAAAVGADLLITGDVKHHAALDASAAGLAVIDAGHHATEWPFVPALAARLGASGIEGMVSEVHTDPFGNAR